MFLSAWPGEPPRHLNLVSFPLHSRLSSETWEPQSWHCPESFFLCLALCLRYMSMPVLKSLGSRPVARFIALVLLAQRRPRSIWTYYHLVLVSALCHCATPTSCLSQWAQCGCMVKNPWVFSRFWPRSFISLLLLILFLLFPCMPLSEMFLFTYLTFGQRWGYANPGLSAQWMNCSIFRAEISHWTQMATNTMYKWANTVNSRINGTLGKYEQ